MGREEREERGRPPVPDIPGVRKGVIETQRELWASRRRLEFSEQRADLFVIGKEAEPFLSLPVLGVPDSKPKAGEITHHPLWMPRVEPATGAVLVTRWETPRELTGKDFVPFGGRKYFKGVDLASVPKSWTAAWLIPQRYPTIDLAIEAADKVAAYEGIAGPAQKRVEELLATLNGISMVFLTEEEISPLRLEGLSRQAESLLREHGLLTARDRVWKKVADYTLRATSRDILGRVNPLVSRILARAAYLAAVHRELRQRAARGKALKLFFYLTDIKEESRSAIENTQTALDRLGGFAYSQPVRPLMGEVRFITARDALPVEHALKVLVKKTLSPVEAAPYGPKARLAEAILVGKIGKSNRRVGELRQSLDERGRRELSRKSAVEYLMEKDAVSARQRMRQAFNVLVEDSSE